MSRPDHQARRDAARATLAVDDLDVLLLTAPADVRYLTGFTGSNGQVLLARGPDGDRLVTDERYTLRAATEAPGIALELTRDPVDAVGRAAPARVGVDAEAVSWATAERWQARLERDDATLVAVPAPIAPLREVKDDAEIASLADACAITVAALEELLADQLRPGVTEGQLASWLERRFVDLGAEQAAFDTIVASGPNAAVPHHAAGHRALRPGDVVVIDCGARVDGYHADCSRTVAVGHVDDQLAEVHAVVAAAQAAGRAAAVAGAAASDVDAAARGVIVDAGYGERFTHGTGHGVGLDIHERPAVARGSSATLRPGTTLTVEPGVYLPGLGGVRIEDTIVVTADGAPRVLTATPRELRVL